jgi:ABC-type multidrug transport system ATPase subunit
LKLIEIKGNINFDFNENDYLAILGEKRNEILFKILGFVKRENEIVKIYNYNFGYVFDELPILENLKVKEFIELVLSNYDKNNFQEIKTIFNIASFENKYLNEISREERKKLAIFFALIRNPYYLIMNEPTLHFDLSFKEFFWQFIRSKFSSVLFSTSDWDEAEKYSNKVVLLLKNNSSIFDKTENLIKKLKYKLKVLIEIKNEIPLVNFGNFKIIKNGFVHVYIDSENFEFDGIVKRTGLEDVYIALNENYHELLLN